MKTYASFNYPKKIYQLPTPRNLAGLRKKRELRKHCSGYYSPEPRPLSGPHPGGMFYLDSDFQPGRYWKWCDEVNSVIDHTGWFCDDYQGDKIRGIVIYLPHGRFLAGWSMGEHMASAYDGTIYTDENEAARAADREAETVAENEREYREEEEEEED